MLPATGALKEVPCLHGAELKFRTWRSQGPTLRFSSYQCEEDIVIVQVGSCSGCNQAVFAMPFGQFCGVLNWNGERWGKRGSACHLEVMLIGF